MHRLPRILLVVAILLSGAATAPSLALPSQSINWQLYADAYEQPETIEIRDFTFAPNVIIVPVGTTVERARKAMDSVYKRLNTKHGIKLSTPGFNGFDPNYGGITTYPPGAKENGGIFLHPNPWAMIAETMLGNGDRAYEYYSQINPAGKNDIIDLYEIEPYVYAQNILGDEHPQFGLGRNSWLSGTASWCYHAGTPWILGIRAEYDGLRIDPCIPSKWDGFKARRKYRDVTYHITVKNPQQVCKGVAKVTVNGKQVYPE